VSSFFPGRYAVDALQVSVHGPGIAAAGFSIAALLIIGIAACAAAARLFRWDVQDRFNRRGGLGWVSVAIAPWIAIGVIAESRPARPAPATTGAASNVPRPAPSRPLSAPTPTVAEQARGAEPIRSTIIAASPAAPPLDTGPDPAALPAAPASPISETPVVPQRWMDVTRARIDYDVRFERLPPDDGVILPIAGVHEPIEPAAAPHVADIERELDNWAPGRLPDPEQRARNLLYIAGVIDLLQLPAERYVPRLVFAKLQREVPRDDLEKLLYWIGVHWASGEASAVQQMAVFGLDVPPELVDDVRNRASAYSLKLLGRLTGKIPD